MAFWSSPPPAPPAPPAPVATLSCSFCTKSQREVRKLIAGPNAWICDECIGLCEDNLREEAPEEAVPAVPPPPDLGAILRQLGEAVVGQPFACAAAAAALFVHQSRPGRAPRILFVGPRGCGKSTLARAFIGVRAPGYHCDCSRMSETGYVGENVENLAGALLGKAATPEAAWRGVLFLDSLHHLVRERPPENRRDVAHGTRVAARARREAGVKLATGRKSG